MVQTTEADSPPTTISHYTTLQGLQGIVQSGCLWASNASFLNDKAELRHALKASKQAIRKLSSQSILKEWRKILEEVLDELADGTMPDTYVTCFCRNDDNLSQWRGYGGNVQGISITFDRAKLSSRFKAEKALFFKVIYSDRSTATKLSSALTAELRDIAELDRIIGVSTPKQLRQDMLQRVSRLLPRFKHLGFQDEKEWRFAIQRDVEPKNLLFRVSSNKIVPYMEIGKSEKLLPITSIRVGPGPDQELTSQSLQVFMTAKGYSVPIEVSQVPFRS